MTDNIIPEPWSSGGITVGFIPEIHGEEGKSKSIEVTRFEVDLLVRYWIGELRDIHNLYAAGTSGSWEIRMRPYADGRIASFIEADMISAQKVNEMAKEIYGPGLHEKWWSEWKEAKDWGQPSNRSSQSQLEGDAASGHAEMPQ